MITNAELNQLTVAELKELRNRLTEILQLKLQIVGQLNKDKLCVGMKVECVGIATKIKRETFIIEKIKNVKATCKSTITGIKWEIPLSHIVEYKEIDLDLLSVITDKTK